jgi:peptidoglycan pentaglycine glycine transferase (the first glycine)
MLEFNRQNWNEIVSTLPGRHVLQTWEWGEFKKLSGWSPMHKVWHDSEDKVVAAALILARGISLRGIGFPLQLMYIPRGPLLRDWYDQDLRSQVLDDLRALGKQYKAIFIKIDPEVEVGRGVPGQDGYTVNPRTDKLIAEFEDAGWISSAEQVQFKNTLTLDLSLSSEELLSKMKQKTRYNIRLAVRKGVTIRPGSVGDLEQIYQMYAETAVRDGFTIRNENYYLTLWRKFIEAGIAEPLLAVIDGEPVAGVIIFRFAGRAWYMYGMSREIHREKMPNYLLQWEAMLRAKEIGCVEFDLCGAPDEFEKEDDLWGVYRFKRGLGGEVVRYIGAWDLPLNPLLYRSYTQLMPRFLALMRQRGSHQTEGSIQAG